MNCPYCNEEMKKGLIQSARPIFWGEKKHKISFKVRGRKEFSISDGFWNGATAEAYHCLKCKKVIIDMEELEKLEDL